MKADTMPRAIKALMARLNKTVEVEELAPGSLPEGKGTNHLLLAIDVRTTKGGHGPLYSPLVD